MGCGGKEMRILSCADMDMNPKELGVYFVRGCGGFERFKLLLVNSFLGLLAKCLFRA